nr:hypothetical protein GCM10020093_011740 [Planobispora longispora]
MARPLAELWEAMRDHEEATLTEVTLAHVARGALPERPEAVRSPLRSNARGLTDSAPP